jgi:predicted esterase
MTTEDRENEIADYVAYLDSLVRRLATEVSPQASVTALGFSQGAATVSRWVAAARPSLKALILWGGLLPPEFKTVETLGGLTAQPLRFVVGTQDRYFGQELVTKEIERLAALQISVETTRFDGGHTIEEATLRSLAG